VTPYKIVLADDHVMFRQGIRNFIEKLEHVQISGEADDGLELLELLKTSVPDLIILDIAMPKLRGLEALREVKKRYPQVKVVILTMHGTKEFVRQAVSEGADGFILKEEPSSELIDAIKAVRICNQYFSSRLSEALLSFARGEEEPEILTEREKEILQHLARGMSSQKISESLYISVHTVRRHRYNIMQKLNLHSMTELIKYAISKGYVE
jgi:DNA-binding NarL/FixJ family response regulator